MKALICSSFCPAIYEFAYKYKKKWTRQGFRCRLIDALLFNRLKRRFGRRLERIYCSGSPLLPETGLFLRLHLNAHLTFCYGATEVTGTIALGTFDQFDHGNTVKCRLTLYSKCPRNEAPNKVFSFLEISFETNDLLIKNLSLHWL